MEQTKTTGFLQNRKNSSTSHEAGFSVMVFLLALALSAGLLQAAGFEKEAKSAETRVLISSEKLLTTGSNTLELSIVDKGKAITDAQVSVKVFMPAMPGMPAMESTSEAKAMKNGKYSVEVNFSMSGTWQLHIFITPPSKKTVRIKTSANI
jgi:hypothetical protein